jgi:hypothetical protein
MRAMGSLFMAEISIRKKAAASVSPSLSVFLAMFVRASRRTEQIVPIERKGWSGIRRTA